MAGLAIGGLVVLFTETANHSASFVLFSGQDALPQLLENTADWSVGALLLLSPLTAAASSPIASTDRLDPQAQPSLPPVNERSVPSIAQDALDNALLAAEHSGNTRAVV